MKMTFLEEAVLAAVYDRTDYQNKSGVMSVERYRGILRRLLCRAIDIEEIAPNTYKNYDDADWFLKMSLDRDGDNDYDFEIYDNGKLIDIKVTVWDCDNHTNYHHIKLPYEFLTDDWHSAILAAERQKEIKNLQARIESTKKQIEEGPAILKALEEKLALLQNSNETL